MSELDTFAEPYPAREPAILVLTERGPGAALLEGTRLVRPDLRVASPRTALGLMALTWVPLLVLSVLGGVFAGGATIPFLRDFGTHTRFLFSLPLLVLADVPVGARLRKTVSHFLESGLVTRHEEERFSDIVNDTLRLRDSRVAEIIVVALAYLGTVLTLLAGPMHGTSTWYRPDPAAGLTAAGYWQNFVAIPVFQFFVVRWVYRMFVWGRFLRRVSSLDLQIVPTHPDGAGGLGFLGKAATSFGIILFALSAVLSAGIGRDVLFAGAKLEVEARAYGGLVVLAIAVFAGPLILFAPRLLKLKQAGLLEYGTVATRYTQMFDSKWVRKVDPPDDPLLGSADIQSLADLGNSYAMVSKMRVIPIESRDLIAIALPAVIPAIPLTATVMPVADVFKTLLRLLA